MCALLRYLLVWPICFVYKCWHWTTTIWKSFHSASATWFVWNSSTSVATTLNICQRNWDISRHWRRSGATIRDCENCPKRYRTANAYRRSERVGINWHHCPTQSADWRNCVGWLSRAMSWPRCRALSISCRSWHTSIWRAINCKGFHEC